MKWALIEHMIDTDVSIGDTESIPEFHYICGFTI